MKWMIASDLHGSAYYTAQLLEAYAKEQAERLILLGDLLYHGPRNALPKEYDPQGVITMLNAHSQSLLCVRGNCDTEVDQMVLTFPILADYAILTVEEHLLFATHGHRFHSEQLPPIQPENILLHGHTHIPRCEQFATHRYCNPGSVSIPKEGSANSYMTIEDSILRWKTLEGREYHCCDLNAATLSVL